MDSKDGLEGDKLRELEMAVFFAGVKEEVESAHGYWKGTKEQNCAADSKISKLFKACIKD